VKLIPYDDPGVFDALRSEWNDLLRRSHSDIVFSTWEWQSSWWFAYEPGQIWVVAIRDDNDRLVALAPWFIETNQEQERVVRSIGCVDVTDYVDILVEPEYQKPVFQMLAEHLYERRERYDRVNLCNIPEASPTREEFAAVLRECGFAVDVVLQEVCPVIELPDSFDEYLDSLEKKQRHELRRKMRRAESEGTLNWYIVGLEHDLETELDRFLKLMAASHPEKAQFLSNPKNMAFFRSIVPKAYEQGWLQLAFVSFRDQVAAAYLNFDYEGHILVYNSGLLLETFGHLSPGIVLLTYLIRHAIETNRKVFDFLRGNETYKYRMGARDTRVYKLKANVRS